ncbi:carboxypeptidase-like regulatory domain-containing protein [Oceanobacillus sp. J11TS1]|uniref:carboxypeptidase-like regulatory domain-containing protein n=1 Tax=Oceanobacillus sp. J11TS1 TaxID=2807191 RepID=UPI001B1FE7CB|nr:carboxypeptidase-like regulatory domain-containing protein [Oceanobacillus sp. J11TS1]GIO21678.1 hypothetical protein J11TS1_02590 [Oceanobacillus sp. J11TS1]
MKIKLKVKHIAWILVIFLILLPACMIFLFPQAELWLAKQKLENGEASGKAKLLDVLDKRITYNQRYDAIQTYMIDVSDSSLYDITISPTGTGSTSTNGMNSKFSWDEKAPHLQDYIENGPLQSEYPSAVKNLAFYYQQHHEPELAKEVYTQGLKRLKKGNDTFLLHELQIFSIEASVQMHDFQAAAETLQEVKEYADSYNMDLQMQIARAEAEMHIQQGELELAANTVEQLLTAIEKSKGDILLTDSVFYEELQTLDNHLQRALLTDASLREVTGRVTYTDGTPIADVGIFLRDIGLSNYSILSNEANHTETNENGEFTFHHVLPGNYQITAGFSTDMIDGYMVPFEHGDILSIDGSEDKVYDITLEPVIDLIQPVNETVIQENQFDLEWEPVEGASYYMLEFTVEGDGASYSLNLDNKITTNKTTIELEDLYFLPTSIIVDEQDTKEDFFEPSASLGFTNPNGTYSWGVSAYDSQDQLISSSGGYRLSEENINNIPIIHLQNRELTNADELLLDGKLKEALQEYKENAEKDEADLHSLRMITVLIGIESDGTWENRTELALPYYIMLADQTENADYAWEVLDYYQRQRDWENYNYWFQKYIHWNDTELDSYTESSHATALLFQGKIEQARKYFQAAAENDLNHADLENWFALELFDGQSIRDVMNLALQYPSYDTDLSYTDWSLILHDMYEESGRVENYQEEIKHVLSLYILGDESGLNTWIDSTELEALKKFMQQLKEITY